ncbi:Alpha-pyrone synthesis polyketide synthase-like Pks11 (plasmid) [Streptomyces sp. YIM 121038]|uniref:type III polyketide synthase n=1 Tax=Streptomyces sp. YIM 121038 TaxID=2136401 RepID=UPI001110EE2B|nr:type III polyketide synthase [Streptomyces sp. YIM 121038]QCX82923.1 Alpha-pyrone synthesis polyketide synthase-like Pks11 [Streptomyces sp. YIM 121038]
MPLLCRPAVAVPEHVITQDDTLALAARLHADHPQLRLVLRLIEHTGVVKRHIIRPIDQTLEHSGFTHRSGVFEQEAKKRVPPVVDEALANAVLVAEDIDAIVFVSCTGFMMPSLTSWMINELGFRTDTVQLPIAQLGCAAGTAAINRATDYCVAHPGANTLIVACEFCSLCYQPDDHDVSSLLSNGLFGDAVAAAVVRGDGEGVGVILRAQASHVIPGTSQWIAYEVKDTGFHFRLNKGVPGTMQQVMPELGAFVEKNGLQLPGLDFYVVHTGGPRVLDALRTHGHVPDQGLQDSWHTLAHHGNIASAAVFDVLCRTADSQPRDGACGIIAGFGPGITMELALGTWQTRPMHTVLSTPAAGGLQ